jgi:hypothetical protein
MAYLCRFFGNEMSIFGLKIEIVSMLNNASFL